MGSTCDAGQPGTLVWAKYGPRDPWWPAEVESRRGSSKVRVLFFGEDPSNGDVSVENGLREMTASNFFSFASTSSLADFLHACAQAVPFSLATPRRSRAPDSAHAV